MSMKLIKLPMNVSSPRSWEGARNCVSVRRFAELAVSEEAASDFLAPEVVEMCI